MICLMPNCGFLSETSRMLEIHRALTARGAEVMTLTHGGPHLGLLRDHGVEVQVLGEGWTSERVDRFIGNIPGIGPTDQSMWSDDEIREYVGLEADQFRRHRVRVVVSGWTLTALLSTQVVGVPLVTEHAGAFLPPLFERGRLRPPDRPLGLPLEQLMPRRVRRFLFNKGVVRQSYYTDGLNRAAAELGVPGVPSFPALLMGDVTLVTDLPEVMGISRAEIDGWRPRPADRYRPGATLRCTGPLFAHLDLPVPAATDRFLDAAGPVAFVTPTSVGEEFVRAVVTRVRDAGVRVLVASVHDLADLESERVHVEGVLPNHLVMPRADLAVIAGGQGSVQTALASGSPFVGFALQPEQAANLDLAVRLGAAREVALTEVDSPALTTAVRNVLTDGAALAAARRVRDLYAGCDGAGAAADAILEVAESRVGRAA